MARQNIDYTTSALNPPNAPADDGLDTGTTTNTAVRPVIDGEPAQAAVFKRPSENLRTRTEILREEINQLKYMSDADKAMLLTSTGNITWNGLPTGTFVPTQNLILKPFLAPSASTAARLIICANTQAQITIRTRQNGVSGQPRAYSGANDITIDFQPVTTGTGAIVLTTTGDGNRLHVQYDDHPVSGTTADLNALNGFITQFNADAVAIGLGLEAVAEGTGSPVEVGFPTPPPFIAASLLDTYISAPEKATRYMAGAAEAEVHIITPGNLSSFFAADGGTLNKFVEGDVLCIWYDTMVGLAYAGRRQSLNELPENSATIPAGSLFMLRRFPDRLPNALPVATVVNGQLIFISGRVYNSGETGPLVSSGSSYQGSSPNAWADSPTSYIPAGSFESAVDTIVTVLGNYATATSGGKRIGNYPAGNIAATNVQDAINELDSEKFGLALNNTATGTNIFSNTNTFSNQTTFNSGVVDSAAIIATGNGNKEGVRSTGGATADGVYAKGGASGARGVYGVGTTGFAGVQGDGGPSAGAGVYGSAGTDGYGVWGAGNGTGRGVLGEGAPGSATTTNIAPVTGNPLVNAAGVVGLGSLADGWGVVGKGNGGDGGGVAGIGIGGASPGVLGVVEGDAPPTTSGQGVVGQSGAGGVLGVGLATSYGVRGETVGTGPGVIGASSTGVGVQGESGGSANNYGVVGHSNAPSGGRGVYGYGANNSVATGVYGQGADAISGNTNGGAGVIGKGGLASGSGTPGPGVQAWPPTPFTIGLEVIGGNSYDLTTTEGDVRIGDTVNRIKMGIAVSGGGAGDATIASQGGINKLSLGAGSTTAQQKTIRISGAKVGIAQDPGTEVLEVTGNAKASADLKAGGNVMASGRFQTGALITGAATYLSGSDFQYKVVAGAVANSGPQAFQNRIGVVANNSSIEIWTAFRLPLGAVITSLTYIMTHGGGGAGGASLSVALRKYSINGLSPAPAYNVSQVLTGGAGANSVTLTVGSQLAEPLAVALTATAADRTVGTEYEFFSTWAAIATGASVAYNYLDMIVVGYSYQNIHSYNMIR